MTYKYPPIYKYGFLLLTIYMLMKHQKIMAQDKLLTNSIIITLIVSMIDFAIINNHPYPFFDQNTENFEDNLNNNYDDYLDYESINDDYDLSIEKDIESLNSNNKNMIQVNYLKRVPQGSL